MSLKEFSEPKRVHDEEAHRSIDGETVAPENEYEEPATADEKRAAEARDPAFLVGWDGPDDIENPKNWSRAERWYLTVLSGILVLNATFASSSPSGVVPQMIETFGFDVEVATLLISMFVAGYCVGPLVWGPLSEVIGRRPVFLYSFVVYTAFQVGCALSPNTGSILVFRFLGGCFAASPLANSGALMGDVWDAETRGKALALFTIAPFAGPALGPAVGGFIAVSGTNWRWLFWVLTIFAGVCTVIVAFTLRETYAPVILKRKAERKRKETGDERWYAPIEAVKITPKERAKNILVKPWKVLFAEPMLMAMTIYMSFIYGCLYLCFEAYPIVFQEGHGFNAGISGLMFMPLLVGAFIGVLFVLMYFNPGYEKLMGKHAPNPVPPEARLPMGLYGGVLFTIGFFWFGWTSYEWITFWAPMLAGGALGLGLTFIFLSLFNYIIDTYLAVAASALAATTVVRSAFGAVFPLFARQMYVALNPRWASTILGCVAALLVPIPLIFMRFGPRLRAKSKYSQNHS